MKSPPWSAVRISGPAGKPCSASSPASSPDSAPRDWWNLMVGVPQCAKVPADWVPASDSALWNRPASKPSSDATADAPPNGPITPGECQPRARIEG